MSLKRIHPRITQSLAATVAAAIVLAACGDDSNGGDGTLAVAVAPTSINVAPGATGTSTATITRGGSFSGPVTMSASGAPAGVTDPNPANNSADDTDTLTAGRGCDVNGDGLDEIVTGAGPGGGPHVQVLNPSTGAQLASFFAYDPEFRGGVADLRGSAASPDYVQAQACRHHRTASWRK